MNGFQRAAIGALGGLSSVCVKFLGQDYEMLVKHYSDLTPQQITNIEVGYLILMPILMFLGGLMAWATEEKVILKLLAIGIAAPAMVTTYAGGNKGDIEFDGKKESSAYFEFVRQAYAGDLTREPVVEEQSFADTISGGVKTFFGYNKEIKRYWVIVGSYKNENEAGARAKQINDANKGLNAWVGVKVEPNQYYPVIVGDYLPLSQATKLKEEILASGVAKDVYLSPGAKGDAANK